jgi:hypothetical protein
MKANELITNENYEAINNISAIIKQDMAIQNALDALNKLMHINRIEFETGYGDEKKGLNQELLFEVSKLQSKLEKAQYNRF